MVAGRRNLKLNVNSEKWRGLGILCIQNISTLKYMESMAKKFPLHMCVYKLKSFITESSSLILRPAVPFEILILSHIMHYDVKNHMPAVFNC